MAGALCFVHDALMRCSKISGREPKSSRTWVELVIVDGLHKVEYFGQQSLLLLLHVDGEGHGSEIWIPDQTSTSSGTGHVHAEDRSVELLAVAQHAPDVMQRTGPEFVRENVEVDALHHLQRDLLQKAVARLAEEEVVHTLTNEPCQELGPAPAS